MTDPAFLGVTLGGLLLSAVCCGALLVGVPWGLHHVLASYGWWSWLGGVLGGIGAALLSLWLFVPIAIGMAAMFVDTVAKAVERRFYPTLPPARGAPLAVQVWDGVAVGLRVLGFSVISLLLAVLLPGVGLLLGWAVSAWGIGRGLFVATAMRRMGRAQAEMEYKARRGGALALGAVLALAGLLPPLNLLVPVLGTAAMVHLLYVPPAR